jgi:hypothetical protein
MRRMPIRLQIGGAEQCRRMSRDRKWWRSGDSGWWGRPGLAALVQQSEVDDKMEDGDGWRPRT